MYVNMQLSSKDTFDIMMLEPPSLPDNGKHEFNQPFVSQPRLAMLDAPTVLRLTCQDNLSSVRVCTCTCMYDRV